MTKRRNVKSRRPSGAVDAPERSKDYLSDDEMERLLMPPSADVMGFAITCSC